MTTEARLHRLLVDGLGGDAPAYRLFLTELAAYLRGFLRRRLSGAPEDAEDLVQELLLAIHLQRHTYDAAQPVTAWAQAIARYKLVDLWRRRGRRERLHEPVEVETLFAADASEAAEARLDLDTLLASLPDRHRIPIELVKLEGLSVADAAHKVGMSESAVKIGIHRGLKALARLIGARP